MVMFARFRVQEARRTHEEREAAAEARLASVQTRPSAKAAPMAAGHAAKVLRPLMKGVGGGLSDLKRGWTEIIGASMARATAPEKFAGGVLTIRAASAVAPFVQHQQALIMERCTLAGVTVTAVKIVQGTLPKVEGTNLRPVARKLTAQEEAALAAEVSEIPPGRLRDALTRLGRAVRSR
jgi:hypothetical protein